MFTHGLLGGAYDKYCRLDESIAFECMKTFLEAICGVFESNHVHGLY